MNRNRCIPATGTLKTVMIVTVLLFSYPVASQNSDARDAGCGKWRDSLLVYGIRSLDSGRVEEAGRYLAGAFRCGMRKDSMHFFLSELYLRKMALDTALVFNMAVEQAGTFPKERWIEQRAKLYWLIGKKDEADSLLSLLHGRKREGRYECAAAFSFNRTDLKLNPFTFVPQNFTLFPDNDIDDAGLFSMYCSYYGFLDRRDVPWMLRFSASSPTPVPGKFFHDELTDTLVQYAGFSASFGNAGKTPELTGGMRMGLHEDGVMKWYLDAALTVPAGKWQLVSISHNETFSSGGERDYAGTAFSWIVMHERGQLWSNSSLTISHQFSRSAMFQNKYDSAGVYPPVPMGFIRMNDAALADTMQPSVSYYNDTLSSSGPVGASKFYWDSRPRMFFLKVPKQSLAASLQYGFSRALPFRASVGINGFMKGVWYTDKLSWYSRVEKKVIPYLGQKIYDDFAIVFNSVDGRYYLVPQRTQRTYFPDNMQPLEYHRKVRMDAYVQVSATLKMDIALFGEVYCRGAFTKGFTSLSDEDPLVSFNRSWEIAAGWKRKISVVR